MQIEAIRLLKGSHSDTGKTGVGCFMNVIAYLNGEPQITDQSPCVCPTVRPIAIWLNDYMTDEERPQMLPLILRAMGSATDDIGEMVRRAELCVPYAEKRVVSVESVVSVASVESAVCAVWAERAASAVWVARAERAVWAASAAASAAARTASAAARAVERAERAVPFDYKTFRAELIADTFKLLSDMLPPMTEPQAIHVERINKLRELATA